MPRQAAAAATAHGTMDKDATIRSTRSHRSNRSLRSILSPSETARTTTYKQTHGGVSHTQPPPPPYHQHHHQHACAAPLSPDVTVRRDSSPSTILSHDSSRWEERNPRWSVWTADTTLNLSDDGTRAHLLDDDDEEDFDKTGELSSVPESNGGESQSSSGGEYMRQIGGGPSSYTSSSRPPSPTTEAALDAALSSTMLALTTANSLLLSTMSSRRELARLRAMEAALEKDLARREAEVRRQLESNRKTIRWMERACGRLDDVLNGRDTSDIENISPEELARLTTGPTAAAGPGSAFLMRHNRAASTAVSDARDVPIPFGVVEAKDQTATIGKSAAKRLERMLQRTPQEAGATNGGESSAAARSPDPNPAGSIVKPSRLRPTGSGRALHIHHSLGSPGAAAAVTLAGSESGADTSLESVQDLHPRPRPSKQSLRSESELSTTASSVLGSTSGEQHQDVSASQILSKFVARPSAQAAQQPPLDESMEGEVDQPSRQYLTPPTNTIPLPVDEGVATDSPATPSAFLRHRPSLSSARSPSSLRVESGPRSSVADQVSGVAVRGGSRKGALEALRRLNGGSSTGEQAGVQGSATATGSAERGGGGWGGTLASWMGIGAGGANEPAGTSATQTNIDA